MFHRPPAHWVIVLLAAGVTLPAGCGAGGQPDAVRFSEGLQVAGPGYGVYHGSATYTLASGARQGPDRWYVLNSQLTLTLSDVRVLRDATDYVSVSTNAAAAQLLKVRRFPFVDVVKWSQFGLLSGGQSAFSSGRTLTIPFENYLQEGGVQGGSNTITLSLEQSSSPVAASAVLLPGSGIGVTDEPPGSVRIRAQTDGSVAPGAPVTIEYEVSAAGFAARNVVVRARTSVPVIWERPPASTVPALREDSYRGVFTFLALEDAPIIVEVTVDSENAGNDFVLVEARSE